MAVADWSTTPAANTSIDGLNIAEGCPSGNMNGAIRAIMASVKVAINGVPQSSDYIAKTGGVFTGAISRQGGGSYLYHADSANQSGRIFVQAQGGAVPAGMVNGDILIEFA